MPRAPKRLPDEAEQGELDVLRSELSTEFSDDNPEHVALLKRLWSSARLGDEAYERVSEQWTVVGFQQRDPVSDLRGGGVLALRNLVEFFERQPCFARPIMASRATANGAFDPEAPGFYPFATAGINITMKLAELAGIHRCAVATEASYWALLAVRQGLDECYALFFRLVDRSFDERGASYMDFNAVLKEAGAAFKAALESQLGTEEYVPQRIERRDETRHDGLARALRMAPPGWGRAAAQRQGALEKLPIGGVLSSRKLAKWRRRHVSLRGDVVAWFKPARESPPQGSPKRCANELALSANAWAKAEVTGELTNHVRLTGASSVRTSTDCRSFKVDKCCSPDGSKGKLRLRAGSRAEASQWMAAMERAIHAAREDPQIARQPTDRHAHGSDEEEDDDETCGGGEEEDEEGRLRVATMRRLSSLESRESSSGCSPSPSACSPARPVAVNRLSTAAQTFLRASLKSQAKKPARPEKPPPPPPPLVPKAPPLAPPLPRVDAQWISCADEPNARVYFVHRATGAAQWELPPNWSNSSSGWAARVDQTTGHTYYFYPPSGQTTWELPER